jgi:uncharacterized Zn finger protein
MDPVKMNINLEDTTEIKCDECGNATFHEAVVLRSISRFITGTAQDGMMPIPVFACDKCGHVNAQFMPQQRPSAEAPSVEVLEDQPKRSRFPRPE